MSEQEDDFLKSLGEFSYPLQDVLGEIEESLETDIEADEFTVDDIVSAGKFNRSRSTIEEWLKKKVENGEYVVRKAWHPVKRKVVNAYKKTD